MRYIDHLKKMFVLVVAALSISIVQLGPASAATASEYYLYYITQYTYQILQIIQNPANFAGLAVSWMQQDTGDSSITTQAQQNLATTGWSFTKSQLIIKQMQKKVMADILGKPASVFSGDPAPIVLDIPDINEISFSSLIGEPPVEKRSVDFYGYVKNAAGFNTIHPIPDSSWEGNDDAKLKYRNYFNTIISVESFSAYILSQLAINSLLKVNETRDQLVNTVSSSGFIAQIATEELGRVFRQILLFESQNFVLNAQIQKRLDEMVSAQAMTNTLLIKLNEGNEFNLLRAAKGTNTSTDI